MAKEQKKEPDPPPVPDVPEVAGPPKSYRLYIALGFVSLILFQMIVLGLLLSLIAQQPPVRQGIPKGDPYPDTAGDPENVIMTMPTDTIAIGDKNTFKFTQDRDGGTETFSLMMHVVVLKSDASKFNKQYENSTIAVISSASDVIRASTTEERKEATYTAIRARVKKKINEVLGTPWVQRVFFTEVSHTVN